MDRRSFLDILRLAALAALAPGCALTVAPAQAADNDAGDDAPTDAAPPEDAAPADAPPLVDAAADARLPPDAGGPGVVIAEGFRVLLNDTSCSGHDHWLTVAAGTYPAGVPVHYLGGSHDVALDPTELKALERGERIPFATGGNEQGHGHCGLAWRGTATAADRARVDACVLRSTTSYCAERPRG